MLCYKKETYELGISNKLESMPSMLVMLVVVDVLTYAQID